MVGADSTFGRVRATRTKAGGRQTLRSSRFVAVSDTLEEEEEVEQGSAIP